MKKITSIIALILVILLLASLVSGIIISSVNANAEGSVSEMQQELDEIAKRKEQLEKELAVISDKKEEELEKKSIIDKQISETSSEISILEGIISRLDDDLDAAEKDLKEAERQLEENLELSKLRIRSAYEQGDGSVLQILSKSKNLHELIAKAEIVSLITKKDNEVIETVKKSKETIEQKRAEIKEKKEENEKAASKLENRQAQLERKQSASEQLIDEISGDEAAKKRAVAEIEAAEQQLQSEIRAAIAAAARARAENSGSGGVVDAGDFRWPLDSKYHNITSPFGYRTHPTTGVYKLHSGADISSSGIRGASVYAAKGGTVLRAGYNRAYGNYVLIDHGDGYSTLYGHCDSLVVSAGTDVTKGDVIGYVGSTGYSTGPHLHFEVIKNGEYTNPLSYFSGVISFTYS